MAIIENVLTNSIVQTYMDIFRNVQYKSVKLQAYKGQVRPGLEYASAAWDPFQIYLQDKKFKSDQLDSLPEIILMNLVP